MVAEQGNPPPIKKRTRIKINQPYLTDRSENKSDNNLPKVKPSVSSGSNELHIDIDDSDEEDTRTYEIKKTISTEREENNEIVLEESDDDDAVQGLDNIFDEIPHETSQPQIPIPAPRTKLSIPNSSDDSRDVQFLDEKAEEDEVKESPLKTPPPQPRPRSVKPIKQEPKEKKEEKRKKKKRLSAAEVLTSVLKKDRKKSQQMVEEALPEAIDSGKEESGDICNSWDSPSPPPPQALNKVYIQNKHGFSVYEWADLFKKQEDIVQSPRHKTMADIALCFHDIWTRLMTFSHGVIAGIACCHILSVGAALAATQYDVKQFVQFYHFLSLKVHFAVYIFTCLCVISCFDRLDIGNLSRKHLTDIARSHGTLLTTVTYLTCLVLSLTAHRHTAAIEAYKTDPTLWDIKGLHEWFWVVTCRDILLLSIWIFIAFTPQSDLLRYKLTTIGTPLNPTEPIFSIESPQK